MISGGQFAFADYFLFLAAPFKVSDGSTLSVVKVTFKAALSGEDVRINSVILGSNITANLTVSNHSQVIIEDNAFEPLGRIANYGWIAAVVCLPISSPIALINNAALLIRNNSFAVNVSWASNDINVYSMFLNASALTVTDDSSLIVEGFTLRVAHKMLSGSVLFHAIFAQNSPCSISNRSRLTISKTHVEMTDVWTSHELQAYGLFVDKSSPLNVSGSSMVTLSDTNFTVVDMDGQYPSLGILYLGLESPLSVSSNSSVLVQRTAFMMHNGGSVLTNLLSIWTTSLLATGTGAPISLSHGSQLTLRDTSVIAHNITTNAGVWYFAILSLYLSSQLLVADGSSLIIVNTVATHSNMTLGFWRGVVCLSDNSSPINVTTDSVVSIESSRVSAVGLNASFSLRMSLVMNMGAPISVDHSSGLTISSSQLGTKDCFVTANSMANVTTVLFNAVSPLLIAGKLSIVKSTSADSAASVLNIESGIEGGGDVLIQRAALGGDGEIVSVPSMLGDSAPTFHMCYNAVGGVACSYNNNYPCAPNIVRRMSICQSNTASQTVSQTLSLRPASANMTVRTTISDHTQLIVVLLNVSRGTTIVFTNAANPCVPVLPSEADPGTVNETSCNITVTPDSFAAVLESAILEGRVPGVYVGSDTPSASPAKDRHIPLIVGITVGGAVALTIAVAAVTLYVRRNRRSHSGEGAPFYSPVS